jgi:hypothetical protein
MDNTSYHSLKAEKVPSKSWTKERIRVVTLKKIKYDDSSLKLEFLNLISPAPRDACSEYKIDKAAATADGRH